MIRRRTRPAAATGVVGAAAIALAMPFVSQWEGRSLTPYRDIVGVWTVCDGDTTVEMRTYTDAECAALLQARLAEFATRLGACIDDEIEARLPPRSAAMLVSWSYNVGTGAACNSTLVKKLNAGDFVGACNELLRWNKAGGQVVRGLVNRRAAEREACLRGLDEGLTPPPPPAPPWAAWWPWLAVALGYAT